DVLLQGQQRRVGALVGGGDIESLCVRHVDHLFRSWSAPVPCRARTVLARVPSVPGSPISTIDPFHLAAAGSSITAPAPGGARAATVRPAAAPGSPPRAAAGLVVERTTSCTAPSRRSAPSPARSRRAP